MIKKTRIGTKTHFAAKIASDRIVVAIVDAIGNGSMYLRTHIDGGWYYSLLQWDRCDDKRSIYPALVGVYKYLKRRHLMASGLRELVHVRADTRRRLN